MSEMTYSEDTPFGKLVQLLNGFNKTYPGKPQPITDSVLTLLNDLGGIGIATQWMDAGWFDGLEKYTNNFDELPDLTTASIKHLKIDFGDSVVKIESEFLLNQIHQILRDNLTRKFPRYVEKKEGNKSPWLRTISEGRSILEQLYAEGITDDFFAYYFDVEPETFKRKRQDIISIRTVRKTNS